MTITKINVKQICSIQAHFDEPHPHYKYLEQEKVLGVSIQKAGYYYMLTLEPSMMNPEEIERGGELVCNFVDKVVYYKPHLTIRMSDGNQYVKFFEDADLLDAYAAGLENVAASFVYI